MSEQEGRDHAAASAAGRCPACGKPYAPDDRFCAECGTRLESEDGGQRSEDESQRDAASSITSTSDLRPPSDSNLWLFAAKPLTVIGGGLLLLALAAVLLFAGQRDDTGTIVMLALCLAPLALITFAIGLARAVIGRAGVGGRD